ncbi:MAG: transporter [Oscillospiraceae bacterium]|nr:transporter [Oscillospiraceae bacterium]
MAKFDKKVFLALHLLLLFYSCSSVLSKLAAGHEFLSLGFLVCYGGMFMILVIYAVGWQQILKHLPLTVAFANKAVTLVWSMVFGALLFQESIKLNQLIGCALAVAGVILFVKEDAANDQ